MTRDYNEPKEMAKRNREGNPNVVKFSKISPILTVGVLLSSIGLITFLHEYYSLTKMLNCFTNFPAKFLGQIVVLIEGIRKAKVILEQVRIRIIDICKRAVGATDDNVTVLA